MAELDLDSKVDITKDYGIGVVINYTDLVLVDGCPWVVYWTPLAEIHHERHTALEVVAQC